MVLIRVLSEILKNPGKQSGLREGKSALLFSEDSTTPVHTISEGNENVILCERGIRSYDSYTRNVLDLAAVPVLKGLTHLPVIVDPSHATGVSRLVRPMACAATAAGADGLIIEVHNDPVHALCDGAQSLTPELFTEVAQRVNEIRSIMH